MKPRLTTILILLFATLGLIEGVVLSVLCDDILKADRTAKQEFKIVKVSQDMSSTIVQVFETINHLWSGDKEKDIELLKLRGVLDSTSQEVLELGEPTDVLKQSVWSVIDALEKDHQSEGQDPRIQAEFSLDSRIKSMGCCREFLHKMRKFKKHINQSRESSVFGLSPIHLIYAAAVINILYLIFIWYSLRQLISRPIHDLAVGCRNIAAGQALLKFSVMTSELQSLQDNFHAMSLQVIQNQQRRKSYVDLFGTRQYAVIAEVRDKLLDFSNDNWLMDKANKKLQTTVSNLSNLQHLLQSMTKTLENNESRITTINAMPYHSSDLLSKVQSSMEALLEERRITLDLEQNNYEIELDPELIRRVILNLVSNAVKYSPIGGRVKISVEAENDRVNFRVQDEGPGISTEGQNRLFQRYGQLVALDGIKRSGTGLGLVICKELIEAHHGEIGCKSTPGSGSCFWFSIPLKQSLYKKKTGLHAGTADDDVGNHQTVQTNAVRKSITFNLVLILSIFAIIQSVMFFRLNQMFGDLTLKAKAFAGQRKTILDTNELYIRQVLWGQELQIAGLKRDLSALPNLIRTLSKIENDFKNVYSGKLQVNILAHSLNIVDGENQLLETLHYIGQHLGQALEQMSSYKDRLMKIAKPTEREFRVLFVELQRGFDASYDWSRQLRSEMLVSIVIAAGADLCLILIALLTGMNTAKSISLLNSKAMDFAEGNLITPSIRGETELAFLDKSLCDVSSQIHNSELERQELMAVINHDLRTPLSSVLNTLELFSSNMFGNLLPEKQSVIDSSSEQLKALLSQVNDLLMLEKIDFGAYTIAPETVSTSDLIATSINNIAKITSSHSISISQSVDADLNQSVLVGDKQLLTRLFTILLANAAEHSDKNSTITLTARKQDNNLLFETQDAGKGINPNLLPTIFERFRYFDGKPVSGLGLPLAYRICRVHGGNMQIVDSGPAGTRIRCSLPVVQPS